MSEPTIVNAGARLDRLPISAFHWRLLGLIGAGGLLDAFDVYLAGGVMAAMVKSGFSDLAHNAVFISATFFGMLVGAGFAGYLGDRFGRRYSYQTNLLIFGVASLAACLAPNIQVLSALRFVMGLGLGAELVVAAGTLCEFIPPAYRGRWISLLGLVINSGLLVATSLGFLVIPHLGWRWMFAIAGAGALVVWVLRKQMPESPRWLESVGRTAEAEVLLARIEAEAAKRGKLPPVDRVQQGVTGRAPLAALFGRDMLGRTLTAALTCVAVNMSVYGFVAWLPTFLVKQGMTIVQSLGFTTLMSFGSTAGALVGLLLADRVSRQFAMVASCVAIAVLGLIYPQLHDGASITVVGFALITAIYTLVTRPLRLHPRAVPDRVSPARHRRVRHGRARGLHHHALPRRLAVPGLRAPGRTRHGHRHPRAAGLRRARAAGRDGRAGSGAGLAGCRADPGGRRCDQERMRAEHGQADHRRRGRRPPDPR